MRLKERARTLDGYLLSVVLLSLSLFCSVRYGQDLDVSDAAGDRPLTQKQPGQQTALTRRMHRCRRLPLHGSHMRVRVRQRCRPHRQLPAPGIVCRRRGRVAVGALLTRAGSSLLRPSRRSPITSSPTRSCAESSSHCRTHRSRLDVANELIPFSDLRSVISSSVAWCAWRIQSIFVTASSSMYALVHCLWDCT